MAAYAELNFGKVNTNYLFNCLYKIPVGLSIVSLQPYYSPNLIFAPVFPIQYFYPFQFGSSNRIHVIIYL